MKIQSLNPAWIAHATILCLGIFFFTQCITPRKRFEKYTTPARPDYSLEKSWAALPTKKDSADTVPYGSSLKDNQANAQVDVFFVHPTLYFKGKSWNADLDDEHTNFLVDKYTIREQASVFNSCCRVYAPRYRQATLASFKSGNGDGRAALDTAYNDIKAAFQYYLDHYNQGRPIIIAGHSQGTFHATRLIQDFFDKDPQLRKRLVAAYLIGGAASKNMFTTVVPCDSASQTGCYVAWHTRKWGTDFRAKNERNESWPGYDNTENYECVNPLTWRRDTAYATYDLHKGAVPSTFDRIDVGLIDAKQSSQQIIWVHAPKKRGYPNGKNYHVMDYGLFYMNIRENVELRVKEYLAKH